MKRLAILGAALICAAFSLVAHAQSAVCTVTGPIGYHGSSAPSIIYDCGDQPPPTCTPPAVLDPATNTCKAPVPIGCSDTQIATIAGKTFRRQCVGAVYFLPYSDSYVGDLFDLGRVLGNTAFPKYARTGQSPTFVIESGYYVSLAFTPQAAGQFKLTANASYGDGGTISVSTAPGAFGSGAAGVVCSLNWGPLNSIIVSTNAGSSCPVVQGKTYYLNLADTNPDGAQLCFGAPAGSCASSFVSYQLSARAY